MKTFQDADSDGLTDGDEVDTYGTNPTMEVTDEDGLIDGEEVITFGTDPLAADTDADDLSDREEVVLYGTDPTMGDTDEDGISDADEIEAGTDPLDPLDPPNIIISVPEFAIGSVFLTGILLLGFVWMVSKRRRRV